MRTWLFVVVLAVVGACDNRRIVTEPTPAAAPAPLPPVIVSFTADATRLNSPFLDTFLRWDVIGSVDTRCRIDSFGQPGVTIGNVPLGGWVQVRPGISRDYALSCTNAGGTAIRFVGILVG